MDYLFFIYLAGLIPVFFISLYFYGLKHLNNSLSEYISQSVVVALTWPVVLCIILLIWLLED